MVVMITIYGEPTMYFTSLIWFSFSYTLEAIDVLFPDSLDNVLPA